jgi:hypothetical protein
MRTGKEASLHLSGKRGGHENGDCKELFEKPISSETIIHKINASGVIPNAAAFQAE